MREDEARPLVDDGALTFWSKGWFTLPLSLAWLARNEDRHRNKTAREAIGYLWQNRSDMTDSLARIHY